MGTEKDYCIFSAQYLPHMGGVENYTYHLAKELVKKGNRVTIVTSNVENVKTYEEESGIEIYRIPCWNMINGRFPILKLNKKFWKINTKISKKNYDMVIVNTRFYLHSIYGVLFGKKNKIRTIFIEHGTGHLTLHNKVLDFIENIVEHSMTYVEKRFCKEFYGVSEACLEWLKHFHIKGKGVLYNAIDLQDIEKKIKQCKFSYKEKYHISNDGIVISFTGRLLKEKGILTLIKAVEDILKTNNNVYLLIAGDGGEWKEVKKFESEHIILLGRIDAEKVVTLLKDTDIFCLPSDSEGMPTSVLEAVACKAYVVTTSKGGAKELICDDSYGIIMDNNDLCTVKRGLEKAIANKEGRENAVELVYQRLQKCFTWEKVAEKLIDM